METAVPVREGGGDDLDVADLAVQPDDPLLHERDAPPRDDVGDPAADEGVVVGMEQIDRRSPDQLGGLASAEEPSARGVRQRDLPATIQQDGIRRDLDEVPVALLVPGKRLADVPGRVF